MLDKPDPRLYELISIWRALPWHERWRVYLFGVYLVIRKRVKAWRAFLPLIALAMAGLACSLTGQTQSLAAQLPTATQTAAAPAATQGMATPSPTPPALALVTAHTVNLRTCPGLDCVILDTLSGGQLVTVHATQTAPDGGTWSNVTTQTGQAGWVNSKYLKRR